MKTINGLVLAAILSAEPIAPAQDHLKPMTGALNTSPSELAFASKLHSSFFKDAPPQHLARMICLPCFEARWAVTIYRDEQLKCTVEYVMAERRLPGGDSPAGQVKRVRVPIDPEAASVVQAIFRRMLRDPRYPETERTGGGDSDFFIFSRNLPPGTPLAGSEDGAVWEPEPGSRTHDLVAIGKSLQKFAIAAPTERLAIREEMLQVARRLDSRLGSPIKSR